MLTYLCIVFQVLMARCNRNADFKKPAVKGIIDLRGWDFRADGAVWLIVGW
ncbi:MAG: hypothetical protein JXN64_10785 [Spirochaetes bacterium]|nr:hypothetical protein [Spirochaetota bacterium]